MMSRTPAMVLVIVLVLSACVRNSEPAPVDDPVTTVVEETTSTTEVVPVNDDPFYLMLMWHQHQPLYPTNEDGVFTRPWVRLHATKDYYDMAAMLEDYPNVKATFNLTPVLLQQLEALEDGTRDLYWVHTETAANRLSGTQKQFIVERFFDTNRKIIARFPRYQELLNLQSQGVGAFSTQDILDLQVLFNLAWTDPDFLDEAPLKDLVNKGRDFTEDDKALLLAEHERIIGLVRPIHTQLWESGQIEMTTTPLAHPILPLIADSSVATVGDPTGLQPQNRFFEIPDATEQVRRGLDEAERLLGKRPVGMWPGEGAVAQLVMPLFAREGVRWVATGEDVLNETLDAGFERNEADVVTPADTLYRPWNATLDREAEIAMFFRDVRLSDQLGFEYSGMSGEAAADDFMSRLEAIKAELATTAGPHVVSVILDGENAWENYDNDGKDFLNALYERLSGSEFVTTITPTEYIDLHGESLENLPDVWPGAWFSPNYATWIGEAEEATAWDYLYQARQDLHRAETIVDQDSYERAFEKMLFAQGSDWFWWYGADQNSGNDDYFDGAFRELLGQMYDELGDDRPAYLSVPIIPSQTVEVTAGQSALITPSIDGNLDDAEWEDAGRYDFDQGAIQSLQFGYDRSNLYVRVDFAEGLGENFAFLDLYLGSSLPARRPTTVVDDAVLGFGATHMVRWDALETCLYGPLPELGSGALGDCETISAADDGNGFELAIPLKALGPLVAGDRVLIRADAAGDLIPNAGPGVAQVADISNVAVVLGIDDPIGDDHGPGSYTYPTDAVFTEGSYDLKSFEIGVEENELVISFEVNRGVRNPWDSPTGLSIQTFDVYIDKDPGAGTGARILIPGRNAALEPDNGWEYGITIEGWDSAIYIADTEGSIDETNPTFSTIVLSDRGKVISRIPLELLGGGDPYSWGYAGVVLSQEEFPTSGVRRVRDVESRSSQFRLGGAPADTNHTRIIDLAWPFEDTQETLLGNYPSSSDPPATLAPDSLPQVPIVTP
ncbi:MAG: glycoside hydrolase [Acidimicrobiia bacterium]|nr:glycoside hydrolase [Acidimicrobiia bacterium]